MHTRLLWSRVIHADDTPVKLRVAGRDRTTRAHLWVAIGDADFPYVVFDFTRDCAAQGPQAFFGGYAGYLQADALARYEGLYRAGKIRHVCCWAHARREFVAAHETGDDRAARALEWIGKLYAIERALPPLLGCSDDPAAIEQRRDPRAGIGRRVERVAALDGGDAAGCVAEIAVGKCDRVRDE